MLIVLITSADIWRGYKTQHYLTTSKSGLNTHNIYYFTTIIQFWIEMVNLIRREVVRDTGFSLQE
jgi:hypothetical protein